jgi:CheY-like chemotaxis protein
VDEFSSKRVLVVDDNQEAAEATGEFLGTLGHAVAIATEGSAAVDLAATFHPQVCLVDLELPEIDGYEVARRLRRGHSPALRLIALTGSGRDEDRERTKAAGFDAHLVKPIDLGVLERAVAR